jgi:hypothetical protein
MRKLPNFLVEGNIKFQKKKNWTGLLSQISNAIVYLADDARAKSYTKVNGKLNAAQERQTKSRTSTTGTGTTSRSMQIYLKANKESENSHGE